jgi:hypothetical protein
MKYFISVFFIVFNTTIGKSQVKIDQLAIHPYNKSMMASYSKLNIRLVKNNDVYYFGLGYIVNPPDRAKGYDAVFYNKAYATNFLEHWMLNIGYERTFRFGNGSLRIFPFSELIVGYTGAKVEYYQGRKGFDKVNNISEHNYVIPGQKFFFITMHLGIGCEIPLSKKIGLSNEIALAPTLVHVVNGFYRDYFVDATSILFYYYSIGLNYKLN